MKHTQSLLLASLGVALVAFCSNAHSHTFSPNNTKLEKDLIKICKAIKSNKRFKLTLSLKKTHISMNDVKTDLTCNGMTAFDYALSEGALLTAKRLSPELSDEYLATLIKQKRSQTMQRLGE